MLILRNRSKFRGGFFYAYPLVDMLVSGWLIRKAKTKMTDGNYTRGGWWPEATVGSMFRDGQDLTAREADH